MLVSWISIQQPLELGDIILIVPHETEPYRWSEAFVIQVRSDYVHLLFASGYNIRRARGYLWVITNKLDENLARQEVDEFPAGFEPPIDHIPPPSRPGIAEIYYNMSDE